MIKFFRRIRQKLLQQGQTSRYLTYAIGEIFLVVIGILIALQINNWNKEREINRKELFYLKKLQRSLEQDSLELNDLLKNSERQLIKIDSLQEWLSDKEEYKKGSIILPSVFFGTVNARIETSTFDELKSTGNLEIIENKAIIDSLMHYYKWIDFIQVGVEQSIRNYTHLNIGPYLMEKYPMNFNSNPYVDYTDEKYSLSNWKLREDFFLTNALEWRKILINSIRQGYGRAQSKNGYLLKMLNADIKD